MKTKSVYLILFIFPFFLNSQNTIIKEGIPDDLKENKIIFFKHQKIQVTADPEESNQSEYLHLRQINHNEVIEEANQKLKTAALDYPFDYAIATKSTFEPLLSAGYKYILDSEAYNYKNLESQPKEDVLIIYEFFIRDLVNNIAYKVFELDEMKIYDSKLMIKKLNKATKKKFPEAY